MPGRRSRTARVRPSVRPPARGRFAPSALFLLLATHLACASSAEARRFTGPTLTERPFVVRAEHGTEPLKATRALARALKGYRELRRDVLGPLGAGEAAPIELRLFRDQQSYRQFAGRVTPLQAVAHFSRRDMRVYIAADATEEEFRHELTHAILETQRPKAPYWIHEGLAGFAQFNRSRPDCRNKKTAALPVELLLLVREHLHSMRSTDNPVRPNLALPEGLSCSERERNAHDRLLAAYLLLYLHQQGAYGNFLKSWQAGQDPEFALLSVQPNPRANHNTCASLAAAFRDWLESRAPQKKGPGC